MMIDEHIIEIWDILFLTDLRDRDKCPRCKKGILKLHGYGSWGTNRLECYECGFYINV